MLYVPSCSWRAAAAARCRTARSTAGAAARPARAGGAPRTRRPASAPPAGHNGRVSAERIGTERLGSARLGSPLPEPHSPRPPGSCGRAALSSGPCAAAAAPGTKRTPAPRLPPPPPPPPCCPARSRKRVILPRGGVARRRLRAGACRLLSGSVPSPSNGALLAPPPRAPSPGNGAASPRSAAFARKASAWGGALAAPRRDAGRSPPSPLPRLCGLPGSLRQAPRGAARRRSGGARGSPSRREPLGGPRGGSRRRAPCQ